ncbi:restriction endonuclease [Kitasatospora sp. NPDC088779]|uniref:restriction endonuclease n=1 Tax=Kitasatospora sp. NPDC088779 TaxID=3154964 RepID=UPI00342D4864
MPPPARRHRLQAPPRPGTGHTHRRDRPVPLPHHHRHRRGRHPGQPARPAPDEPLRLRTPGPQTLRSHGLRNLAHPGLRDDGVDAVATLADPTGSTIFAIQAKRSKNVVPVNTVRAMSGVIDDKDAGYGIAVTTSWFGKDSYDFAHRNGRLRLIDGRNLKALLTEHLNIDALIGLPKVPRAGRPATSCRHGHGVAAADRGDPRPTAAVPGWSPARSQSGCAAATHHLSDHQQKGRWPGISPGQRPSDITVGTTGFEPATP